jgi:hypothetical protein
VQYHRVVKPFLALQAKDEPCTFFSTIDVGSVLSTDADLWQPGLVPITLRGENLLTFARDLRECTEVLDQPHALSVTASASASLGHSYQWKPAQREQTSAGTLKQTG